MVTSDASGNTVDSLGSYIATVGSDTLILFSSNYIGIVF